MPLFSTCVASTQGWIDGLFRPGSGPRASPDPPPQLHTALIYGAEVHFLSVPQFPAAASPADQGILSPHDMLYGKQESASGEDQTGPPWGPGTAGLRQGWIGPLEKVC